MRLFGGVGGFVVLSVVLGCPALGWASAFTFTSFDVPSASPFNATSTLPYGINGSGEVVGTFVDTANKTHGYLQDAAGFHAIDVPNAASTEAYRVNQSTVNGSKIVGDYTDNSGKTHGFYTADKGTTFKTIDIP